MQLTENTRGMRSGDDIRYGLTLLVNPGTRSRDRTGTVLLPLVFETSASTNSAIRAGVGSAKIGKKSDFDTGLSKIPSAGGFISLTSHLPNGFCN